MKHILYIVLIVSATLIGCKKQATPKPTGTLTVSSYSDIILLSEPSSASTKATLPQAPDNYTVNILHTLSGSQTYSATYGEIKGKPLILEQGLYRVIAENIPYADVQWDAPRYAGHQDVTIDGGYASAVNIVCKMTNTKVTIQYTTEFLDVFTPTQAEAKTSAAKITFTPTETRAAYFAPDNLSLRITGVRKRDNQPFTYIQTITGITAAQWCRITIDLKQNANSDFSVEIQNDLIDPDDHNTSFDPTLTKRK